MTSASPVAKTGVSAEILKESWEYTDADTQQLTHNIHRYSGKFIPQIAARAISLLTQPGDLVVDPYCGSGTTLVESVLLNRRVVGVDLNPLAVLIAQVKTTPLLRSALAELVGCLDSELVLADPYSRFPLFEQIPRDTSSDYSPLDLRFDCQWFRKWFQPHVLRDLIAIDFAIQKLDQVTHRNFARVAFSDILRRSSSAHTGYPNVMFDKRAPSRRPPIPSFFKTLNRNLEMVASLSDGSASWSNAMVIHGNAASLPMGDETVDAVISHPPYVGSIPYAEYGVLSLRWLGVDTKQLDHQLTGGRRQSKDVVRRFEDGYGRMLTETHRVLKPGRYTFLMVGNPVVRGHVVDLAEMTLKLACAAGLEFCARTTRRGANRRANKMGSEHLLFFRKPLDT